MHLSQLWVRSSLTAVSLAVSLSVSGVAAAEGKCGDQICPKNWECKTATNLSVGLNTGCAPDQPCRGAEEPAEPTTYEYCSPLPCTSDSQCADDMVCYSEESIECDEPDPAPCAKDEPCVNRGEGACRPTTRTGCVPRYLPACDTADDCGSGFTCEVSGQDCSCGGSGSSGGGSSGSAGSAGTPTPGSGAEDADDSGAKDLPADAGAEADPAPPADGGAAPECVCEPSTVKQCKLTVVACTRDSDCQEGFTCEENPSTSCWASSDGSSGCDTPDPARLCAPPYTDRIGGASYDDATGGAEPGKGLGGVGVPPRNEGGGSAGSSSNGAPATDGETAAGAESDSSESGGCSVGHTRSAGGVSFAFTALSLVGLLAARRRRR